MNSMKDIDIEFPHFTVLKASAGSGKTYTLTKRYVQFLLSKSIKYNKLPSILAITFSNNAAKEMKTRILKWLKELSLKDNNRIAETKDVISISEEELSINASNLIDEIINNYSDFAVKTIDSFMTSVFKASAIDLDYPPDFEILMNNNSVMEYAFNIFLRKVKAGTDEARLMEEIINTIGETKNTDSAFLWEPTGAILNEIIKLYNILPPGALEFKDRMPDMFDIQRDLTNSINMIELKIERSRLARSKKSKYDNILRLIRNSSFADLAGETAKTPPINKPKDKTDLPIYDEIIRDWEAYNELIKRYTLLFSQTWYLPYIKVLREFNSEIDKVKKQQEKVFIEDINRKLADYIDSEKVPDVYFRIGDTIYHYLIDEFQDTSPVQWKNLQPLIENSLSVGGSLFCVGDTKQAIYGFRDADYTIMRKAETDNPFPSAAHSVFELDTNYRSKGRILEFNEQLFKGCINNVNYAEAAKRSGLTDYIQKPLAGNEGKGHVSVMLLDKDEQVDDSNEEEQITIGLINKLKDRGYNYADIAILATRNEDVINITKWLSNVNIPFISYSNLDIRKRKITSEIISLINFLDSPLDDLSFVTVCLGSIMHPALEESQFQGFILRNRRNKPLYKVFQREYPTIWKEYFSELFTRSGYLPLYDLVTEIYRVFMLFDRFENEEATLVKILEVIKSLEETGANSLREFLINVVDTAGGDSKWNIDLPDDAHAVKVMTVHKSKGLGFEVCIELLREEKRKKPITYIIPKADDKYQSMSGSLIGVVVPPIGVVVPPIGVVVPPILKISKKIAECDPELLRLYEEEQLKELTNSLNILYVGFTRPKEELYIIGSTGDKKYFPIDILPLQGYANIEEEYVGAIPKKDHKPQSPAASIAPILHRYVPLTTGDRNQLNTNRAERQRGEFIHKVLSHIDYIDDLLEDKLNTIIKEINIESRTDYNESEISKILMNFLYKINVSPYFGNTLGRTILNEQEFLDSHGIINRMDRVVIDTDIITVIDYKSGSSNDNYDTQINRYKEILGQLYPEKKIEGIVLYIEEK